MPVKHFSLIITSVLFLLMPSLVSAATYQQNDYDTAQSAGITAAYTINGQIGNLPYALLGTGLSGDVESVSIYLNNPANCNFGNCPKIMPVLYEATSTNFWVDITGPSPYCFKSSCGGSGYWNIDSQSGTYLYATTSGATKTLDPTKYYYIGVVCVTACSNGVVKTFGSNTATSSMAYVFTTTGGYTQQGIVSILNPEQYETTTSINVPFSFTYWIDTSQGLYSYAGYDLVNITTGTNVDTTAGTSTINASGLSTFNYTQTLISGNMYRWVPWLKGTGVPKISGTATTFWVVNRDLYQSGADDVAAWEDLVPEPDGGFYSGYVATSTSGSSTTSPGVITTFSTSTCMYGMMEDRMAATLQQKFPFSYICDFRTVLNELANGDGSVSGDVVYDLPMGKTANGSSSVTLIDKEAIAAIPAVSQVRELLVNAMYLMWGIAVVGFAMKLI